MVDLRVNLSGLELSNPVIPASGCFGYGREFAPLYDLRQLGSISIKGTTLEARAGNESPRVTETASGMLNAVGLENPGVKQVIKTELPFLAKEFAKPVIANVSGFSFAEYIETAKLLAQEPEVGIIELNISCPNVKGGGISFGQDPHLAADLTTAVKAEITKPLYVKLSPNVTNITEMALACESAGADGLSLINTLMGMRLDLETRKPILANVTGGLSGPAIFPIALKMVYEVYQAVKIPLIGMGGISSAADVIEMMLAGASAVQIGAANLVDPWACPKILAELPSLCASLGIKEISSIVGGGHHG